MHERMNEWSELLSKHPPHTMGGLVAHLGSLSCPLLSTIPGDPLRKIPLHHHRRSAFSWGRSSMAGMGSWPVVFSGS